MCDIALRTLLVMGARPIEGHANQTGVRYTAHSTRSVGCYPQPLFTDAKRPRGKCYLRYQQPEAIDQWHEWRRSAAMARAPPDAARRRTGAFWLTQLNVFERWEHLGRSPA